MFLNNTIKQNMHSLTRQSSLSSKDICKERGIIPVMWLRMSEFASGQNCWFHLVFLECACALHGNTPEWRPMQIPVVNYSDAVRLFYISLKLYCCWIYTLQSKILLMKVYLHRINNFGNNVRSCQCRLRPIHFRFFPYRSTTAQFSYTIYCGDSLSLNHWTNLTPSHINIACIV